MPTIAWVTPAPLWGVVNGVGLSAEFRQPQLLKIAGDSFMADFLAAMQGQTAGVDPQGFLGSADHNFDAAEDKVGGILKLYHPAHNRYYLAVGSLVCRQPGLPDRAVKPQNGERTSFVIRRRIAANGSVQEQGWVDEGAARGWQPLVDDTGSPVAVRADEELLPAHLVAAQLRPCCSGNNGGGATAADAAEALAGDQRTLYYGYIPVGNREKYADRRPVAAGAPAEILQRFEQDVRQASSVDQDYDFRMDEVTTRVVALWHGIVDPASSPEDRLADAAGQERAPTVALYLILDLADWLDRYLPEVLAAVTGSGPTPTGARKALCDDLEDIDIKYQPGGSGAWYAISLAQAIERLAPKLALVRGTGTEPADRYDIRTPTVPAGTQEGYFKVSPPPGRFHQKLKAALAETTSPADVPGEVIDLLKHQVTLEPPDAAVTAEGTYFLRFVYQYPPCAPVVSEASPAFTLARYFDPDAPARNIRIQLPSISMKDLRRYKRGVGLEMSPELRDVMNRVHKKMLEGEGLQGDSGGWELGMICTFSLQIIFLVAFIVMFIFLILLNIVFWWLPFLKICFPIPVKKGGS